MIDMKKLISLISAVMASMSVFAATFEQDGISYDILSAEDHTVEVVNNKSSYVGDVVIPARVQYDGVTYEVAALHFQAFFKCTDLYSVSIPETVTDLGAYSFTQCTSLEKVELPSNAVAIPNGMFWGCSSLKSINLPSGVKEIGEYAFANCSAFEEINLSNNIESIGKAAFMGTALKEFILPDKVVSLSPYMLALTTKLDNVVLHDKLKTIGECAFQGNTAMRTLELPEGLQSIDASAFAQCVALTDIKIPDGITALPAKCFYNDMALQTVVLGKNVSVIGSDCFARYKLTTTSPQLKDVYLYAQEIVSGGDSFIDEACEKATLHVPAVLVEAYKAQSGWQRFNVVAITDGESSAVNIINSDNKKDNSYYSLDGKLLRNADRGVTIYNGKKYANRLRVK